MTIDKQLSNTEKPFCTRDGPDIKLEGYTASGKSSPDARPEVSRKKPDGYLASDTGYHAKYWISKQFYF